MSFGGPPALESGIATLAHSVARGAVGAHTADGFEESAFVVVDEAGLGIFDHFGKRAEVACDGGSFAGEGFDEDHAEGLVGDGRDDDGGGMAVERAQFGL